MKKISYVLLIVILFAFLFGCDKSDVETNISISESKKHEEITEKESAYGVSQDLTQNDVGGGEITQKKYRQCYYRIFYQLSLLVDEEELDAWEKDTLSKNPDETNEMVVKLFVQHFNISKEDFEKANLELAKVLYDPDSPGFTMNPKDYINQEMYELYNADIIYTFDDEIINNYYLSGEYPFIYESEYEEAVANGTYTSQTEEWVDIEQLEAEIIAKYGEAEIVAETIPPYELPPRPEDTTATE